MKKFLLAAIMSAAVIPAFADFDIKGQITAIDPAQKTISIQGIGAMGMQGGHGVAIVQIMPYTELKGDDCGMFGNDIYGTFTDLSVGQFVEAEVYPTNGFQPTQAQMENMPTNVQFVAKEVEWKCTRRAY